MYFTYDGVFPHVCNVKALFTETVLRYFIHPRGKFKVHVEIDGQFARTFDP